MFIKETISRLRQAGANGEIVLRADSGFDLHDVVTACRQNQVRFSIGARMIGGLRSLLEAIPEEQWSPIDYFLPGAGVAEITFTPFGRGPEGRARAERGEVAPLRLIVRRTPPTEDLARNRGQDPLFPIFDYHPIITDRTGELLDLEADHRRHAEVELTIRDLKNGMGISHFPTKSFGGNAAWLILNTIAHNLTRWTARLGMEPGHVMTKKYRRRIYTVTGRLVRTGLRANSDSPEDGPGPSSSPTPSTDSKHDPPPAANPRPPPPRPRTHGEAGQTGRSPLPPCKNALPIPPTHPERRATTRIGGIEVMPTSA